MHQLKLRKRPKVADKKLQMSMDALTRRVRILARQPSASTQHRSLARNIPDAAVDRAIDTRARLRLLQPSSLREPRATHTTASLTAHHNGNGATGEARILVCWMVSIVATRRACTDLSKARVSSQGGKVDADLGKSSKPWAVSVSMTDIKAEITEHINVDWTRRRSAPLLPYVDNSLYKLSAPYAFVTARTYLSVSTGM